MQDNKWISLSTGLQWAGLCILSMGLMILLDVLDVPVAPLLAAIMAGIFFAMKGIRLNLPSPLLLLAQSILGCSISHSFTGEMLRELMGMWQLALFSVFSAIIGAAFLGWLLTVKRILPGTTAIWGISPGGAIVMPLLAKDYGGEPGLVAFMQYLRMLVVAVTAAGVAKVLDLTPATATSTTANLVGDVTPTIFAVSLLFAGVCAFVGGRSRIPAAAVLLPAFLGAFLQAWGVVTVDFPPWFMVLTYMVIGWLIGLSFSAALFKQAFQALPAILLSIVLLVLLCAGVGGLLVVFAGIDPLTAYFATSPGGFDAMAILAASTTADTGFVITMQTIRLFVVLALGPLLAKYTSRHMKLPPNPADKI